MSAPTFIDLFSGCGGFTLGMLRAGFDCLAAIDFNAEAVATLKSNLADRSERAFDPLDDFGTGYAGCSFIEYLENENRSPL